MASVGQLPRRRSSGSRHRFSHGPESPILSDEDEFFLQRFAAEEPAPPLPQRPTSTPDPNRHTADQDKQLALIQDGLSRSGSELSFSDSSDRERGHDRRHGSKSKEVEQKDKKSNSFFSRMKSIRGHKSSKSEDTTDLARSKSKKSKSKSKDGKSKDQEDDLSQVLDDLEISSSNNKAFSFSKESQNLLEKFKVILKDLINGVPTAYQDLEKLLTNSDGQLQKLYNGLPSFLQNLIKNLPKKFTGGLGPEIARKATGKGGSRGSREHEDNSSESKGKIPSLRTLLSAQGAAAAILRSILSFLKLRFPTLVAGTNILMSLAIFLLLFVFWYCHKRGKETRLEREREADGQLNADVETLASDFDDDPSREMIEYPSRSRSHGHGHDRRDDYDDYDRHDQPRKKSNNRIADSDLPSVRDLPDP